MGKKQKIINFIGDIIQYVMYPLAVVALVSLLLLFIIAVVISGSTDKSLYFDKATIQSDIKTTIRNGGNLNDVKNVYKKRDLHFQGLNPCYKEDVPLSEILSDLRNNYFLRIKNEIENDSIPLVDTLYLSLLDKIIDENNKKNPFDKLEESQKYHFNNILLKLDSNYVKISPEITQLVDEMYNKNQLVTKYLDDSEKSLRISWLALIVSAVFSLFQICQNWISSKKHKKRFDEIEKLIKNKE